MEVIYSHPNIVATGGVVAQQVKLYQETCSLVLHALQEVVQGMELMRELDEHTPAGVQEGVVSQVLAVQTLVTELTELSSLTQGNEATILLERESFTRLRKPILILGFKMSMASYRMLIDPSVILPQSPASGSTLHRRSATFSSHSINGLRHNSRDYQRS